MLPKIKTAIASKKTSSTDKLLLILGYLGKPAKLEEIRAAGLTLGFSQIKKVNIGQHLKESGRATHVPEGWELTEPGKQWLVSNGYLDDAKPLTPLLRKIEQYLQGIQSKDTKDFLNEAIECTNRQLHRAAVVLSWVGAVSILHKFVAANHLVSFNREAIARNYIKKSIKDENGFSKIQERDFIETLEAISLISDDVKKELVACLDRRNRCGHPNDIKMTEPSVAHHLDSLIIYVFSRYAA